MKAPEDDVKVNVTADKGHVQQNELEVTVIPSSNVTETTEGISGSVPCDGTDNNRSNNLESETLPQVINQEVVFVVAEGQGTTEVSDGTTSPKFSKKLKLLLQGAYRRVTPETKDSPVTGSMTCSSTSSNNNVLVRRQTDPVVYTVRLAPTYNNFIGISPANEGNLGAPCVPSVCPTHRTGSVESYEEVCRICHENSAAEPFITPCLCKGTMGLVHKACLERWLGESGKAYCEICGYEYITARRPKYKGLSSVWSWIRNPIHPHDSKNFFFDVACFFVLTPLACISAWLCVMGSQHFVMSAKDKAKDGDATDRWNRYRQLQDASNSTWTSVGLLTLTGTLLTAYYIWLFIAFRYHYQVWCDWKARNFEVTVLPVSPELMGQLCAAHTAQTRPNQETKPDDVTVINMDQSGSSASSTVSSSSGAECTNITRGDQIMGNWIDNNLNRNPPPESPEAVLPTRIV